MGNKTSTFAEEHLEDLQDSTFFSRKEILMLHKKFRDLDPQLVPKTMHGEEARQIKMPHERLLKMGEFRENPFKDRLLRVFSDDGTGDLCFEDFLYMMSVLSEAAPRELKAKFAFAIYDYDDDGKLGPQDIAMAAAALTQNQLTSDELKVVVEKVLDEGDIDSDGYLSQAEFEHVISRAPEFVNAFHVRA
ncbi:calcium and integrin-binding family member 2-like [Tropilaelaps mercedesae]|uniref:Calcium and integrin-binding family member 2-like n=1 Tax=Tropilaelaps mercedesae TaxID=418985 RepID=A0A1V9XHQ7_9ACAR|nr:calcium and integrin-binding family member 2-like [Tropilaelaps mercedesae]